MAKPRSRDRVIGNIYLAPADLLDRVYAYSTSKRLRHQLTAQAVAQHRYIFCNRLAYQRKSWLDPLVGVRFNHEFNDRWSVVLRGDVGGFGVSSELAVPS